MKALVYQSLRFAAVGLINTAIGLAAIYGFMYFLRVGPAAANAMGYAIGFFSSFLLNRAWTFSSNRKITHVLPRYFFIAAISYLLNLGVVTAGAAFLQLNLYIVQLLGVSIYTLCMFLGCRWFVFSK